LNFVVGFNRDQIKNQAHSPHPYDLLIRFLWRN
jgi:hypothetical protein